MSSEIAEKEQINRGLVNAAKGGSRSLFELFVRLGATSFDEAMSAATSCSNIQIIEQCLAKGATDVNRSLSVAAAIGNSQLIKFFVKKGANDWFAAYSSAYENNRPDTIQLIRSLADNSLDQKTMQYAELLASIRQYKPVNLELFGDIVLWDPILLLIAEYGRNDLVEYAVTKAQCIEEAITVALINGRPLTAKSIIDRCPNSREIVNGNKILLEVMRRRRTDIVEFVIATFKIEDFRDALLMAALDDDLETIRQINQIRRHQKK